MSFRIKWKKRNQTKTSDWKKDLNDQVNKFKPNLIAISSTEDMWELGMKALKELKSYKEKNNVL